MILLLHRKWYYDFSNIYWSAGNTVSVVAGDASACKTTLMVNASINEHLHLKIK